MRYECWIRTSGAPHEVVRVSASDVKEAFGLATQAVARRRPDWPVSGMELSYIRELDKRRASAEPNPA